jgi:hypothetical protein
MKKCTNPKNGWPLAPSKKVQAMASSANARTAKGFTPRASHGRRVVNLGAKHENLDQKAYQILKSMIIERQLLPGDKIPQEKLAEDLGISRTPLVNALKFLENEKLVQCLPRRGFFVRHFSKREMISIFEWPLWSWVSTRRSMTRTGGSARAWHT